MSTSPTYEQYGEFGRVALKALEEIHASALEAKDRELAVLETALQERLKQVRGVLQELEQAEQRAAGLAEARSRLIACLKEGDWTGRETEEELADRWEGKS